MRNLKSCNGCLEKKLIDIPLSNLNICQKCLLVSTKVKKNYFQNIKKDFAKNINYRWNLKREDIEKRAKKWLRKNLRLVPGTSENWYQEDLPIKSFAELKETMKIETHLL